VAGKFYEWSAEQISGRKFPENSNPKILASYLPNCVSHGIRKRKSKFSSEKKLFFNLKFFFPQGVLNSLIEKIAVDHPHHTLFQIFALSNGDRVRAEK
jgi:hypothetical protein